jgi:polyisoprenoid-binding protein YceI
VPAFGQQEEVWFDPARTEVNFTLGAFLHAVHGEFRLKRGAIVFDPVTGKASGLVVVDATSGHTGNAGRDAKMHRQILESWMYPEIVFIPSEVNGVVASQRESHVQVKGILSLHGQEHEMVFEADVHIGNTGGGSQFTAEASFPVPYVKWGLKNASTFVLRVSDTARVTVYAAGQMRSHTPPPD